MDFRDGVLRLALSGDWKEGCDPPGISALPDPGSIGGEIRRLSFDTGSLGRWDSLLMTFVVGVYEYCGKNEIAFVRSSLPDDVQKLLDLSQAVPEVKGARSRPDPRGLLEVLGNWAIGSYEDGIEVVQFVGECTGSILRFLGGRVSMRWRDFFALLQKVGAQALPIVSLISFLMGLIVTFLGAVVLERFGANYYVSYLVGYGVLRELGALMTGIILAGRTGAAFAAEIGSMKVSEEIDALKALGISPVDFLVLPRLAALFLMMPLLVIYADVIGLASGMLVSNLMLDISFSIFLSGVVEAVSLPDVCLGLFKALVFGVLVAVSGCLRGMQSGESAAAVGSATTSAVVTGITLIIFFNAVIDWIAAVYGL